MNYIEYMQGGGISGDTLQTYILPPTKQPRGYFLFPFGKLNFKINEELQSKANDAKSSAVVSSSTKSNNSNNHFKTNSIPSSGNNNGVLVSTRINRSNPSFTQQGS